MTGSDLVSIDLTDEERKLIVIAINEYGGLAKHAKPLLLPVLGLSNEDEWYPLIDRLESAIKNKEPLSDLDWARALFLTEISFASDLAGAGRHFGPAADEYWLKVLRTVQWKISSRERFLLLVRNASYPSSR